MIYDNIKNLGNYKNYDKLYNILLFLKNNDCRNIKSKTVIVEDESFCNFISFMSKPEEICKYEAHKKYIDLHFIVSGVERIDTADVCNLNIDTAYDEEKDIAFYTGKNSTKSYLREGDFMVCYPSDAHKVGMMEDKEALIEKIVVKIKA